ncbi:hypothetical protein COLO4_32190 [Corchorus olitorius]|uniref:Uncharacterized protein n=1 Tax=Corchorus olitorius TaxID=93759 RepID=A0A1R3H0H2_9ROSI|nr:hypothetical protein COLO4_32190 [Corchorus olitorius]
MSLASLVVATKNLGGVSGGEGVVEEGARGAEVAAADGLKKEEKNQFRPLGFGVAVEGGAGPDRRKWRRA